MNITNYGFTHFNNKTFEENQRYKQNNNIKGCIYGVPKMITTNIAYNSKVFIIEMNNQSNMIEGIGQIINYPVLKKKYCIYKEGNYNRYIYKGNKYLSREQILINPVGNEIINYFDNKLFIGTKHRKRGQGIGVIRNNYYIENNINYLEKIKVLFKTLNK
jgi:hypothetical protein